MEGARGDEQDVVRAYHAVLGVDGRAFDQRQQVALHAGARDVGAAGLRTRGDLVDLVEEDDAVLLDVLDGLLFQLVFVDQLGRFLLDQQLQGFLDLDLARLLALPAHARKHGLDLFRHFFHARRRHDFHLRARFGQFQLDFLVIELALAQALAEGLARAVTAARVHGRRRIRREAEVARRRHEDVDDAVFGRVFGACAHFLHFQRARLLDADVDQVADDGVDVAPHIAHFRELGRFDLDERRFGQLGQAARDFRLADARGADHEDVLGRDFMAQGLGHLLAAPAVAQGDGDGALGLGLAHHVFVEFGDDFRRGHVHDHRWLSVFCTRGTLSPRSR